VNQAYATTFNCDGILVASSTGSTAYNVSLGNGVMMHPEVECMILNPMGAISLSSRPLILPKHHTITIKVRVFVGLYGLTMGAVEQGE
jgi:NAD+ kinase